MIPAIETLRQRLGVDLSDIPGASLAGEIPISDAVVNRLIADRLRDHPQVASVRLQAQDADIVDVHVTPRARLLPPLKIAARIERQPEFPDQPVLLLQWTMPGIGPLAMLAAPALAFFKALPRGIKADGDRVAIDVREMLESRGLGEVMGLIRQAAIHTRPGGFVLHVELKTPKTP